MGIQSIVSCKCDNSSVGRALASQAKGRGFEPHLSLKYELKKA